MMDFKDLKEIKDKKNEIENKIFEINNNLGKINDSVIYNQFYFILDNIENNVEINRFSMSSIFDFSEPLYSESKDYINNNTEFIEQLKNDNILKYIGNEYKDIFKNINITLNLYIVNNLSFDKDNMDLDYVNMDMNEIKSFINDSNYNYDILSDLESIFSFYDSLNNCIVNFIDDYGKYIL